MKLTQKNLLECLENDQSFQLNLAGHEKGRQKTSNRSQQKTTSQPIKIGKLYLTNAIPYCGYLSEGYIVKRKYIVKDNNFIAEGLTHSDYTITWEGFDDHGSGKGKDIVDKNLGINIDDSLLADSRITCVDNCLWIGGDTINKPNYAHWMFEHLLKLEIFRINNIDLSTPIIVSDRLPDSFLQWGELLVGKKLNWQKTNLDKPIKFKNLLVSSCPAFRTKGTMLPSIWIEGFKTLRERLIALSNCYPKKEDNNQGILFLSRKSGAKWRRATNEDQLYEIAKKRFGASLINISDYLPIEQIQLLYQSKIIICFGGADGIATNFVNSKTKIFEILAPNHLGTYTAQIYCAINGLKYSRIHGTHFVTDRKGPHPLDRDYYVNEKEFTEQLEKLIQI